MYITPCHLSFGKWGREDIYAQSIGFLILNIKFKNIIGVPWYGFWKLWVKKVCFSKFTPI